MFYRNQIKSFTKQFRMKPPIDVRIIFWILIVTGLIHFFSAGLLLSGLSQLPPEHKQPILFNALILDSNLSVAIYYCLGAMGCLFAAYGINKRYKWAWWLLLIFSIYNISDSLLFFPYSAVSSVISIFLILGIIIWLLYHRKLYRINLDNQKD